MERIKAQNPSLPRKGRSSKQDEKESLLDETVNKKNNTEQEGDEIPEQEGDNPRAKREHDNIAYIVSKDQRPIISDVKCA
jgi:hypothetical protein